MQFVHGDHLGTGAARTAADGMVVESSRQLPFGTQLGAVSRETDFTGKKTDGGTGLHYFGARFELPAVGRFVTSDAVLAVSKSGYAYVENSPLSRVDPDGAWSRPSWLPSWEEMKLAIGMGLMNGAFAAGIATNVAEMAAAPETAGLTLASLGIGMVAGAALSEPLGDAYGYLEQKIGPGNAAVVTGAVMCVVCVLTDPTAARAARTRMQVAAMVRAHEAAAKEAVALRSTLQGLTPAASDRFAAAIATKASQSFPGARFKVQGSRGDPNKIPRPDSDIDLLIIMTEGQFNAALKALESKKSLSAGDIQRFRERGWIDSRFSDGPKPIRDLKAELAGEAGTGVNFIYARKGAEIVDRPGVDFLGSP